MAKELELKVGEIVWGHEVKPNYCKDYAGKTIYTGGMYGYRYGCADYDTDGNLLRYRYYD